MQILNLNMHSLIYDLLGRNHLTVVVNGPSVKLMGRMIIHCWVGQLMEENILNILYKEYNCIILLL